MIYIYNLKDGLEKMQHKFLKLGRDVDSQTCIVTSWQYRWPRIYILINSLLLLEVFGKCHNSQYIIYYPYVKPAARSLKP